MYKKRILDESGNMWCCECLAFFPLSDFRRANVCYSCELASRRSIGPKPPTAKEAGVKRCTKCGEALDLNKYKTRFDGSIESRCKSCCSEIAREKRKKNRKPKKLKYHKPKMFSACADCHKIVSDGNLCARCEQKHAEIDRRARNAIDRQAERSRLAKESLARSCSSCGVPATTAQIRKDGLCSRCSTKARYNSDPEYRSKIIASTSAWQKAHRPQMAAKDRERRRTNPKVKIKEKVREYRERGSSGSYDDTEWNALMETCNNSCAKCHRTPPEIEITVDHIVPITLGGSSYIRNLQPLCLSCNSKKGNKSTTDYRPQAAIEKFGIEK